MDSKTTRGLMAGLTASSIWGGMYVVSKIVLETIPPFALLSFRLLLGIGALGLILVWKRPRAINPKHYPKLMAVGMLGYGVSLYLQFAGTMLSSAANGAMVTAATPAFIFIFAYWILGEKISARRAAALALSTLGVLAVIDPRVDNLSPNILLGNLALVAAALTWALYSVLIRKVTLELDTLPVSLVAFMGGLLIAIPGGVLESGQIEWGNITPQLGLEFCI